MRIPVQFLKSFQPSMCNTISEGMPRVFGSKVREDWLQTPVEVVTILANLKTEDGELANDLATDGVYFYVQCWSVF